MGHRKHSLKATEDVYLGDTRKEFGLLWGSFWGDGLKKSAPN